MTVNLKLSEQAEKIFNGAIQQDLASLESLRLEKVKESNKRKKQVCTLGIPVFLLVIVLGLLINADEALIGISLAFAIYFLVYIIKPEDQFKEEYLKIFKDKFVKSFFAQLFNYAYVDDASSMEEKLRGYQLLKDFNEYKGEDYFHGTVDSDIKLEFAEVETKLKHGSNAYNYFNGGVVLLTMPFKFDSHTVVKANSLISKIEGSTKLKTEYEFDTVDINNATLSKYFTVMSNDKHGAFYLLSPSFIKRLVGASVRFHELFNEEFSLISPDFKKRIEKNKKDGIEDEMNTATLEIEFKDNKVLILIRGQYDFLAPADLHTTVYCTKRLAVIEQQLNLIADLAKQLKLDYLTDRKQAYNKIEEN